MIKLNNISKRYDDKVILNNISFEFLPGKSYAIIGKSGSGKTTLLNIIGMIDKDYTGELIINDVLNPNINKKNGRQLLENDISYMFQDFLLDENITVKENLKLINSDEELILNQLKKHNMDESINKKVSSLSGGEKQRVAFIRTKLKKTTILLCDEPTGSLDEATAEVLLKEIFENKENKTIVIVTHDKKIASMCDVVISISKTQKE